MFNTEVAGGQHYNAEYFLQIKQKVCSFLKKKIEMEKHDIEVYLKIQEDARILTGGHTFLDVLMSTQRREIKELTELYNDICINPNSSPLSDRL